MNAPNLSYINKLAGGDQGFITEIWMALSTEFPEELQNYNEAILSKDYILAASLVHKIKHKFGILDITEGYQLAVQHEESLKNGSNAHKEKFDHFLKLTDQFIKKNQPESA